MKGFRLVWWTLWLAACATAIPEPPAPVVVAGPTTTWRPLDEPAQETRLPEPPAPPLPLPAVRIELAPPRPVQASAVVVRVHRPAGPALEAPVLSVAGRDVRLTRTSDGWAGVAALPLDSAGFHEVRLDYRRAGRPERRSFVFPVTPRAYPSTRIRISAGAASDPEVDARIARERVLIDAALHGSGPEWLPAGPFEWPRPPVRTSAFGQRRMFNGSVASRHLGLDLRGRRGEPVRAAAAGRVVLTGNFYYQGNAVYIDHGLGLVTAYFHFSRTDVQMGQRVSAGEVIGAVGTTGRSTAPHLHWSAYVDGENIDPESLVGLTLEPAVPAVGATSPR